MFKLNLEDLNRKGIYIMNPEEPVKVYDDEPDEVNNPVHYNNGDIECIDAIQASMSPVEFEGYLKGNTLKYLWRYRYKKHPVKDLGKAQWYLNKLLEEVDSWL